jgi:hypothetical protein
MPDWLQASLLALPAILWMIVGLGWPYALVALPRRDWRDGPLVACLSLAFGPALLTAWMLILGTLGQNSGAGPGDPLNPMQSNAHTLTGGSTLLQPGLILAGTVVIALIGYALVWRKRQITPPTPADRQPLAADERVLILLIGLATLGRWLVTVWLPFGSWDPLWVYGYQGRLYSLLGFIPTDIGYYPQFLSLQYAYPQIVALGEINDHAARTVLPFLQIGSILATYVLGSRLFSRRVGLIAAAIWALYPHFGYWTRVGDLEIPMTFGITGAAAFFLIAWTQTQDRTRYAIIAGLMLGIALWTKPTAGGLIWGVVLAVALEGLRVGLDWRRWWPRFQVAFWMGIACLPLGGIWYIRNILIGHDAVTFPPSVWLTRAERSGAEFGWPLLALAILLLYLHLGPHRHRPNRLGTLFGLGLIALGVGPTILEPARMAGLEWLALLAGLTVIALTLGDYALANLTPTAHARLAKIGWAWALGLPYFITWFYSYSYHYRLSFAIVPLMILPTALILAHWIPAYRPRNWRFLPRLAYAGLIVALCLPGVAIFAYDEGAGWDWLWTIPPEGDYSEAALLGVVDHLEDDIDHSVVVAPGLQTLPFFFPLAEIRTTDAPMTLEQMTDATHFVMGNPDTLDWYRRLEIPFDYPGAVIPFQSQWFTSLFRENVTDGPTIFEDDGFSYRIYAVDTAERFQPPQVAIPLEETVVFGDAIRFVGYSYDDLTLDYAPESTNLHMVFEVLAPLAGDYFLYVHVVGPDDSVIPLAQADGPVKETFFSEIYYSTRFWEVGEYVIDRRILYYAPFGESGDEYGIRIGFYDQQTGTRLPVTIDGASAGDGYRWPTDFTVPPPP